MGGAGVTGNRKQRTIQVRIEALAALLLLTVLAALTMLLIFSTGNAYKSMVNTGGSAQDIRTGLLFISTKVRQTDNGGNIGVVTSPWGGNAVVITLQSGGQTNEDWIFYYDGALRETLIPKGTQINPVSCQAISRLRSFSVSKAGNILRIDVSEGDAAAAGKQSLTLTLRT